jgi:hypothetical protein
LSELQSRLAKVQTCFTLVKDDLDASPICPHCLKGKKLPVKIRNDRPGDAAGVVRTDLWCRRFGKLSYNRCLCKKCYNEARTHLSLHKDAPVPRAIQTVGLPLAMRVLGGLHHQYFRA